MCSNIECKFLTYIFFKAELVISIPLHLIYHNLFYKYATYIHNNNLVKDSTLYRQNIF